MAPTEQQLWHSKISVNCQFLRQYRHTYPHLARFLQSTEVPHPNLNFCGVSLTLQSNWDTLTPTGVSFAQYNPTQTSLACPTSSSGGWTINGRAPLPTIKNLVIPSKTATSESPAAATTSERPSQVSETAENPKGGSNSKTRNILLGTLIPVGIIICLIAGVFVYSRRKKRASATTSKSNVETPKSTEPSKPELHSDSRAVAQLHTDDPRRELDGLQRHQLYDEPRGPAELNGWSEPQELSTSASVRRNP